MTLLIHAWDIYYRLPSCTDWSIQGYTLFQKGIQTAEELVFILSNMNEYMGVGCLLFIMKEGILPIWECADNIDGGIFSFSIPDITIWKNVVYSMCGNTLFSSNENNQSVNGISLLYKKGTLVFKLWFRNDHLKVLTDIAFIEGVNPADSHFQYHHIPTAIAPAKHRPAPHGSNKPTYGQKSQGHHKQDHYRQGHQDHYKQGHQDQKRQSSRSVTQEPQRQQRPQGHTSIWTSDGSLNEWHKKKQW
jgi:hypothetical protein